MCLLLARARIADLDRRLRIGRHEVEEEIHRAVAVHEGDADAGPEAVLAAVHHAEDLFVGLPAALRGAIRAAIHGALCPGLRPAAVHPSHVVLLSLRGLSRPASFTEPTKRPRGHGEA